MRTRIDATLCEEARTYRLRFTCEHCAHFETDGGTCAEGFPNAAHRSVRLEPGAQALEFCKSFELA